MKAHNPQASIYINDRSQAESTIRMRPDEVVVDFGPHIMSIWHYAGDDIGLAAFVTEGAQCPWVLGPPAGRVFLEKLGIKVAREQRRMALRRILKRREH